MKFVVFLIAIGLKITTANVSGPGLRVAVCLGGEIRGERSTEVIQSIVDNVLQPLGADVFVYVPLKRYRDLLSPSPEDLLLLHQLPGLKSLHIEQENATATLMSEMYRAHANNARQVFEMTRRVAGNWLGGIEEERPRRDSTEEDTRATWRRPGNGLLQMLTWRRCLDMVERAESMAEGRRYDWVIPSRLNLQWEHPHIPLELLSRDAVWIPEGMDYGGVNDRHAVVPRGDERSDGSPSASEMYLDSWRFLVGGHAVAALTEYLVHLLPEGATVRHTGCDPDIDGAEHHPCINMENWLALRLNTVGHKVKRLPRFDWVVCQPGMFEAISPYRECVGLGTPYRYEEEYTEAIRMSSCLRQQLQLSSTSKGVNDLVHAIPSLRCQHSADDNCTAGELQRVVSAVRVCFCPANMDMDALRASPECHEDQPMCWQAHLALCL